ncbi:MAG: DUF7660 family protein [Methylophilaceae bacterium]
MSDTLFQLLDTVEDEKSFLLFVKQLHADRVASESMPQTFDGFQGEWANQTISHFLEAASAWAEDSDFGARLESKLSNPWRLFAEFLIVGRGYE